MVDSCVAPWWRGCINAGVRPLKAGFRLASCQNWTSHWPASSILKQPAIDTYLHPDLETVKLGYQFRDSEIGIVGVPKLFQVVASFFQLKFFHGALFNIACFGRAGGGPPLITDKNYIQSWVYGGLHLSLFIFSIYLHTVLTKN